MNYIIISDLLNIYNDEFKNHIDLNYIKDIFDVHELKLPYYFKFLIVNIINNKEVSETIKNHFSNAPKYNNLFFEQATVIPSFRNTFAFSNICNLLNIEETKKLQPFIATLLDKKSNVSLIEQYYKCELSDHKFTDSQINEININLSGKHLSESNFYEYYHALKLLKNNTNTCYERFCDFYKDKISEMKYTVCDLAYFDIVSDNDKTKFKITNDWIDKFIEKISNDQSNIQIDSLYIFQNILNKYNYLLSQNQKQRIFAILDRHRLLGGFSIDEGKKAVNIIATYEALYIKYHYMN